MKHTAELIATLISLWALTALADEVPTDVPKPFPTTRSEMKVALEALKDRQPRIPLPEPAEGQTGYLPEAWGGGGGLGGFRQFNNFGSGGDRGRNPNYQLNYLLTDECFWVVSRGNNCHYCLGHQELKLRANGLDDNAIATLDTDWSRFDPRKQLALAFARKLTLEPEKISDADITNLEELFTDAEIIELVFTIAVFNSVNRWTDAMGFPQERHPVADGEAQFKTPTSPEFTESKSIAVATERAIRPATLTAAQVQLAVDAIRQRATRVELPAVDHARRELRTVIGDRQPYEWERALSQLPWIGSTHVATWNTILSDGHLTPRLKAELSFITAVHNHAWYAAAHAAHRLKQLGASVEDIDALFANSETPQSGSAVAHRLAAKITTDPHLITDADIAQLRVHFSDTESPQILQVICMANLMDRFTDALGLPLEDEIIPEGVTKR